MPTLKDTTPFVTATKTKPRVVLCKTPLSQAQKSTKDFSEVLLDSLLLVLVLVVGMAKTHPNLAAR